MSAVANAGLQRLLTEIPRKDKKAGTIAADTLPDLRFRYTDGQTPPQTLVRRLRYMRQEQDPRLPEYLCALNDAGWTWPTLAAAIGIALNTVQSWKREAAGKPRNLANLPVVPEPDNPRRATKSQADLSEPQREWSFPFPRTEYAMILQHVRKHRTPMRDVMQEILQDYLDGTLIVAEK